MSKRTPQQTCSRRTLLKAGTGAAATLAATSGTALAQDAPYDGYLDGANNFDGQTVDYTGEDSVTVNVGAGSTSLAFAPAAINVDPGTEVTWEWTGEGGGHNVIHEDGAFDSGSLVSEEGETFTHTFESEGVYKYYCEPHKASGMRGVVAVGDTAEGDVVQPSEPGGNGGGNGGGDGGDQGESETAANDLALQTLGAMLVLGLLSPIVFLLFVRRKMQGPPRPE